MGKFIKCSYCEKNSVDKYLFWDSASHWCAVCHKNLCKDHRKPTINFDLSTPDYGQNYDLCPECYQWRIDTVANILSVRSSHIGQHRIVKNLHQIQTRYGHLNQDSALWEIKYNAAIQHANAIINLNYNYNTLSNGNYFYKVWTASGYLVIIEPI
jgi:uncharacterized protein YbjQ (UPF0145 family)